VVVALYYRVPMLFKSISITLALCMFCLGGHCQAPPDKNELLQAHMVKAQQYLREKRPDLAVPEFEAILALDPNNLDAQRNVGVLLYFRNDYANAVPHLKEAIKAKPDLWKVQALLGLAEMQLGNVSDGRMDMESALPNLNGDKVQIALGEALIESYSQSGELDKAARTASTMLAAEPTDPRLLLLSYHLYSDLASKSILTLALTAPNSAEIHQVMARELQRQGDEVAAIANYREAIQLNPKLPGLYVEFGLLLYNSTDAKRQGEAQAQFQAALAANPHDERAQLMLGETEARLGDMKAAQEADARAVEMQPNDVDACTEYAKILMSTNQKDKARVLLEHAVEIDPTDEIAHYRLSTLDRQQGKMEDAKRELDEYQKYKDMKAKLQTVFHDMRVQADDKVDNNGTPKQ
jgi:Tfp pilus assembly protein PilF